MAMKVENVDPCISPINRFIFALPYRTYVSTFKIY